MPVLLGNLGNRPGARLPAAHERGHDLRRAKRLLGLLAPLAASSRQVAAPIPSDPPVTTATLPTRSG